MDHGRRRSVTEEELHGALDQLEEAAIAGRLDEVQVLMDSLWPHRRKLSPLIAGRLISGRTRAPLVSFQLLPIFAGSSTRQHLSRIARDPSTADLTRFSARRRMGWAERGEPKARAKFLDSLQDPVATLTEALDQAVRATPYPPSGETLEEVLRYLLVMPPGQAREVVAMSVRMLRSGVSWVLRGLLHAREPQLRELALAGILEVGDAGAGAAMARAANESHDPDFALKVENARRQLDSVPVTAALREPDAQRSLPPIHSAYLSAIDGSGGQVAVVLRRRPEGLFLVSQLYFQDGAGLRDALGMSNIPWESLEELYETGEAERLAALKSEEDGGIPLVEVDAAAVRGAVTRAANETIIALHRFPTALEIWEPLIHEQDPPSAGEPLIAPELDDAAFRERDDLYRRTGSLLQHPFFGSWMFEPGDIVRTYFSDPDSLPFTGQRITLRHLRPMLGALLDDQTRDEMRHRLRRQAWLLREEGDRETSDIALAAAAGLLRNHPSETAKHPLLQGMVAFGVSALMGSEFRIA